jgi:hypothetical protein
MEGKAPMLVQVYEVLLLHLLRGSKAVLGEVLQGRVLYIPSLIS